MNTSAFLFEQLVGEELSAVTFVRDYLQLQFNPPPTLNVLTPVSLKTEGKVISSGDDGFANAIIAQIGRVVESVTYEANVLLTLDMSDRTRIEISLQPEDSVGGESVLFFGKDNSLGVL